MKHNDAAQEFLQKITGTNAVALRLILLAMLLAIVCSSLGVVYESQRNRHLFALLDQKRQAQYEFDAQWGRLMLERSTLLSHDHVAMVASERLAMHLPPPGDIVVVYQ